MPKAAAFEHMGPAAPPESGFARVHCFSTAQPLSDVPRSTGAEGVTDTRCPGCAPSLSVQPNSCSWPLAPSALRFFPARTWEHARVPMTLATVRRPARASVPQFSHPACIVSSRSPAFGLRLWRPSERALTNKRKRVRQTEPH
ncbi:hypothetical protein SJAG_00929 [Schizosaccharomyces japonicus yFS275]|uniref:Uncharacterized protein n=1 Tax=Schizosaccharomyces japonicus (strain yFS275 / FY16936) TaxID=402676 RepID=B6JX03_SCHJY|nr:hypothetical protein SJAG_00929 [Schizosaccharomyces japonicus yFS275]EEB05904.1 hypothetical protein SJAG_00929 [Schizosaccharomyces japonicus yFS275]